MGPSRKLLRSRSISVDRRYQQCQPGLAQPLEQVLVVFGTNHGRLGSDVKIEPPEKSPSPASQGLNPSRSRHASVSPSSCLAQAARRRLRRANRDLRAPIGPCGSTNENRASMARNKLDASAVE